MVKTIVDTPISERYEVDSQALLSAVGCRHINKVAGLMDVIEVRVKAAVGGGEYFLQIILNPWAHLDTHPIVHLLGVDWDAVEPLNEAEGRYSIDIEPDWIWSDDPNLVSFWEECVIERVIKSDLEGGLRFRSLPKRSGAWDLFFPSGAIDLAKKIEKRAKDKGLKLISREESRIIEAQRQAAAEAERITRETSRKAYCLEIEKAKDEGTLEDIRIRVEQDTVITQGSLRPALLERIQARMSEVKSGIDFDKLAKVSDPTSGHRKKGTPVRKYFKRD